MMAPAFVGFVLVVPVFLIAILPAAADEVLLIVFAAEVIVIPAVFVVVQVGLRLVDDYLMAVIDVEVPVAGRHFAGEDPAAFALIDELVIGDIIIALYVGNIIVFHVVIASGAPGWLNADVDGKMDLCAGGVDKSCAE